MLSRRAFTAACAALPLAASAQGTLRAAAARCGVIFGAAVTAADLAQPDYAALIATECAMITPGIEAKWGYTEPAPGQFNRAPLQRIAAFAAARGLRLHLHNFVWAVGLPVWTMQALRAGEGRDILARHAGAIAAPFRDHVYAWDVVNEPIDPRWPADAAGLCTTPWWHALGPDYIAIALAEIARADPAARRLINDDDLEYDTPDRDLKRTQYLRLVERLRRQGAPLTGIGLELHVKPWLPFDSRKYRNFLAELAGLGMELHVTEFDVNDLRMPTDPALRDQLVAQAGRRILDVVLDEPALRSLTCWSLSDRASWLRRDPSGRRQDGSAARPSPFDDALRRKPLYTAMQQAFRAAPLRRGPA